MNRFVQVGYLRDVGGSDFDSRLYSRRLIRLLQREGLSFKLGRQTRSSFGSIYPLYFSAPNHLTNPQVVKEFNYQAYDYAQEVSPNPLDDWGFKRPIADDMEVASRNISDTSKSMKKGYVAARDTALEFDKDFGISDKARKGVSTGAKLAKSGWKSLKASIRSVQEDEKKNR